MRYEHTQKAPLYLLLAGVASGMLAAAWLIPDPVGQFVLATTGGTMAILALAFRQLTVACTNWPTYKDRLNLIFILPIQCHRKCRIDRVAGCWLSSIYDYTMQGCQSPTQNLDDGIDSMLFAHWRRKEPNIWTVMILRPKPSRFGSISF